VDEAELRGILNLYLDWFDRDNTQGRRVGANRGAGVNIVQVAEAARTYLSQSLPSDFPVHFALSVIESVAYATSQFASADQANAPLYRDAAFRFLTSGLPNSEAD
jgi:hypothetical protein